MIRRAMILAAGHGKRLRPLTEHTPKPLIKIGGRTVVERTLSHLVAFGIRKVVINVHHLADHLIDHLGDGADLGVEIRWSRESELLDTGGGIFNALPLLGDHPFLVVNGDILWDLDLTVFLDAFDPKQMAALLGLMPCSASDRTKGDFKLLEDGKLIRENRAESLIYTGIQILHPNAVASFSSKSPVFSINRFYDAAISRNLLRGMRLQGAWLDIGTPKRLRRARDSQGLVSSNVLHNNGYG